MATINDIPAHVDALFEQPQMHVEVAVEPTIGSGLRVCFAHDDLAVGIEPEQNEKEYVDLQLSTHRLQLQFSKFRNASSDLAVQMLFGKSLPQDYKIEELPTPDSDDARTYALLRNGVEIGDRIHIPHGGSGSDVAVDLDLDIESENAIANSAVAGEFARIAKIYGAHLRLNKTTENGNTAYSISLLDKDNQELSQTESFSGGGGGGSVMIVTREKASILSQYGSAATLALSFVSTVGGVSTGGGSVRWYADAATGVPIFTSDIKQSTDTEDYSVLLDVSPWITSVGIRNFYAVVTDSQEISRTVSFEVESIDFSLSNRYPQNTAVAVGKNIDYRYAISGGGSAVKYIHFTLDDVSLSSDTITTSDNDNVSKIISTQDLSHGAHRLTVQGEIRDDYGDSLFSNKIVIDLITITQETTPILSLFRQTDSGKEQSAKVYETLITSVVVYVPGASGGSVELSDNNGVVSYITLDNLTVYEWSYTIEALNPALVLSATCATAQASLPPIAVTERVVDVDEATIGLALKLTARGRTNAAPDRDLWKYESEMYGSCVAAFSGLNWSADGWVNDSDSVTMLHLTNGGQASIPFYLFRGDNVDPTAATNYIIHNYGRTIEIDFRVSNALSYDTPVISCYSGDIGFYITPTKIYFQNGAGASTALSTDFLEGDRVRVGLVFQTTASGRGMYLYLNGKQSGYFTYEDAHSFQQPSPVGISIDSALCDVDLYRVMVYNSALTKTQMLNNYIVGLDGAALMVAVYNRNDIFYNNLISAAKAQDRIPVMIFTAAGIKEFMEVSEANKSMKINVGIEYIDAAATEKSFSAAGVQVKFQGTSSMAYPVRNFKIKIPKEGITGDEDYSNTAKGTYRLRTNSYPVNTFCLKADFAESSGSHNTGAAKLINDVMQAATDGSGNKVYLTPPQRHNTSPYDIRTTIDGFPILLFRRELASDEPVFVGKYNFNNDKSTQGVFGFEDVTGYNDQMDNRTDIEAATDNYRLSDGSINPDSSINPTECWEFCSNDVDLCKFKFTSEEDLSTDVMQMAFESRYPEVYGDDSDYATSPFGYLELKKVIRWVHSTDTELVDDSAPATLPAPVTYGGVTYATDTKAYRLAKFKAELSDHFNVDNILSYFVLTDFLGAVDQRAKNQMMASWGNEGTGDFKWYFIFYDNDTILGLNNSGLIKYDYDLESDTANAYSGRESVLWLNLEACFATELATCWQRLAKAASGTQNILSYESLVAHFNTVQSDQWAEAIYNEDSANKYITQGGSAVPNSKYYPVLQGSREQHRKYWLSNRLEFINGKYKADSFIAKTCYWRSNRGADCALSFSITGDRKQFYGYMVGTAWTDVFKLEADTPHEVFYTGGWDYSDTYVFGYSHITDLGDMSPMYPSEMVITALQRLKKLVVSSSAHRNTYLTGLDLQNKPYLEVLDVRYASNLTSIANIDACGKLKTFEASQSGLRSVKFADGGVVSRATLPASVISLDMRNLAQLTDSEFLMDGSGALVDLYIDNCPLVDSLALMNQIKDNDGLNSVRLLNLNATTTYAAGTLANILTLHNNAEVNTKFSGSIHVDKVGALQLGLIEQIEGLTITYDEIVDDVVISVSASNLLEDEDAQMSASISGYSGTPSFTYTKISGPSNVSVSKSGEVIAAIRNTNVSYVDTVTVRCTLDASKYAYKDKTFTVQGVAVSAITFNAPDELSTTSGLPMSITLSASLIPDNTTKPATFTYRRWDSSAAYCEVEGNTLTITADNNGSEFTVGVGVTVGVCGAIFSEAKAIVCDTVHVGDFVYSDGTTSPQYNASKELIGVCYYLSADKTDRRMVAAHNYKSAVWGPTTNYDQASNPRCYCVWNHGYVYADTYSSTQGDISTDVGNTTWMNNYTADPLDYRNTPIGTWPTEASDTTGDRCYSALGNVEGRQETETLLYWRVQNGYTAIDSEADVSASNVNEFPAAAYSQLYGSDSWSVGGPGSWWLPASGELALIYYNLIYNTSIASKLAAIASSAFDSLTSLNAFCATQGHNSQCAISINFATGKLISDWGNRKAVARTIRPVTDF